jgi:hypothetical protein
MPHVVEPAKKGDKRYWERDEARRAQKKRRPGSLPFIMRLIGLLSDYHNLHIEVIILG